MPVSSSTEHWIRPDALTINLNHFGDPDYLQVSVLAGAVVMAFKQDVIGYNAAHNYRTWPLEAANTYLETSSAYNVYARLTRSEVNARALVIYDTVLRDIEGREISYANDGSEQIGESDSEFFYIFLGQISGSVNKLGEKVNREWITTLRFGVLDTTEQKNVLGLLSNRMFVPHFDNPNNPEELTWIEALSNLCVAGGVVSYLDNKKLNLPSIYDGLPIDWSTIYWEEVKDSDGNVTGRVLKAAGGGGDVVVSGITIEQLSAYLATNKYATQPWVEGNGYLTSITSAMVTGALGFTPFDAASFTMANIKSKLGIADWALASSKPSYTYSEISGLGDELAKYIPISGYTEILGEKNFTGGLKVNGCPLVYDSVNKYWKFEGDLLVTGGVTTHASDSAFKPSTIMDALLLDSTTLGINDNGQLYVKGGGGGLTEVHWSDVIGRPTLLSSFTDDVVAGKYLPLSGGTLTGSGNDILVINRTDGWPYIRFSNNGAGLAYFGVNTSKEMVFIPQNSAEILKVLHSGNYSSYALPLSGGTITGTETLPITISNNINDGEFQVGIRLLNPNKTNTNGNTIGTAQFGYTKSDGVYMFNYDNYNYYNCAIGITDDGIAYVGKGGSITEKYEILHEGNAVNKTVGNATRFNGYSLRGAYGFSANHIDANIMYHLNLTALSSSNFYPVIFSGTQKDLYCNVYSEGRSGGQTWNMNKLEFTFRGQGWYDTPKGLTVHYYDCYDSSETTIGCIGMGEEQGYKVLWLRGGLNYYMISNITPSLKTSTYTATNEVFSVGTGFAGGTNSKVSIYWTPQSTSPLKALYHSGSIYTGGGIQIDGGSRFKSDLTINGKLTVDGLATFNGGLTATTGTFNGGVNAQSYGGYNGSTTASSYRWAIYQWNNELQITRRDSSNTYLSTMLGFDLESGNVGLGITNPSQKLHVYGNILGHAIYFANGTTYYLGSTGNINCNALTAKGATTLKSTLGVTGAVTMESNLLVKGHVTSYSQRSLKNVIDERGLSLKELVTIKPTRYTWKDGRDELVHIGGIADDVQKVLPEVVFDNNGTLTMDYAMAGFAIAASLIKPVAKHEEDIESLKKRIKELELEVERLTMN